MFATARGLTGDFSYRIFIRPRTRGRFWMNSDKNAFMLLSVAFSLGTPVFRGPICSSKSFILATGERFLHAPSNLMYFWLRVIAKIYIRSESASSRLHHIKLLCSQERFIRFVSSFLILFFIWLVGMFVQARLQTRLSLSLSFSFHLCPAQLLELTRIWPIYTSRTPPFVWIFRSVLCSKIKGSSLSLNTPKLADYSSFPLLIWTTIVGVSAL